MYATIITHDGKVVTGHFRTQRIGQVDYVIVVSNKAEIAIAAEDIAEISHIHAGNYHVLKADANRKSGFRAHVDLQDGRRQMAEVRRETANAKSIWYLAAARQIHKRL